MHIFEKIYDYNYICVYYKIKHVRYVFELSMIIVKYELSIRNTNDCNVHVIDRTGVQRGPIMYNVCVYIIAVIRFTYDPPLFITKHTLMMDFIRSIKLI